MSYKHSVGHTWELIYHLSFKRGNDFCFVLFEAQAWLWKDVWNISTKTSRKNSSLCYECQDALIQLPQNCHFFSNSSEKGINPFAVGINVDGYSFLWPNSTVHPREVKKSKLHPWVTPKKEQSKQLFRKSRQEPLHFPKFNNSPLKIDGWKTFAFPNWGPVTFRKKTHQRTHLSPQVMGNLRVSHFHPQCHLPSKEMRQ